MTTQEQTSPPLVEVPQAFNAAAEYIDKPVAAGHGGRTAIVADGAALTYAELQRAVNRFGNAIRSLGVEIEQRVAILLPNRPEFVAAFYGTLKAGAVATPVSFAVTPSEQLFLLADSRAKVLVTTEAFWAPLRSRRAELPYLRHVLLVDGESDPAAGERDFASLCAEQPSALDPAPTTGEDSAFWLHTSGSTGTPKWAMHRHADMRYCEELYAKPVIGLRRDDVVLSGSPCFHAYPLGILTYFAFSAGATVIMSTQRTTPAHMFDLIQQHRVTVFAGVPTLYAQMLHAREREQPDLSSVRLGLSAAEPLPGDIQRRFRDEFGVEVLDGIGSTEALHIYISNRTGEVRPGSSGRLLPGYDVRLLDAEGTELGADQAGSLWVKGGSLFSGYWKRTAITRQVFHGDWYFTGDTYKRDADGYYWYQGRADDMLRVSGHWVSPAEVEACLMTHPAVLEAAVVGKLDTDELVKPKAYVVLRETAAGAAPQVQELQDHVKASIAPYCYPRWIEFVAELPKTATGKIQRFKLRDSGA